MSATWSQVSERLGRNDLPGTLAYAVLVHHTIDDPDEIVKGLASAWPAAEWPAQYVDPTIWSMLFNQALDSLTYLHDEEVRDRADLPDQVTLYRGATEEHAVGMSWTDDLDRARWFAGRFNGLRGTEPGKVWTVTVDSDVVLARFESRRGEAEWVLDVGMLEDYEVAEYEED